MPNETGNISFISRSEENWKPKRDSCRDASVSKKARIIVRNLPFKNLSEDKLKEWFNEFGAIDEVKLLRKDDGKFVGCGFVQFVEIPSAAKAVQQANQREILGRKIIVDWAVPKNVYVESLKNMKQKVKQEPADDGSECSEELSYWEDTKPNPEYLVNMQNQNSCNEDSDSEDSETQTEDVKNSFHKKESSKTKNSKNTNEIPVKSNDVEEGKTIFIRNLPFSVTNDDLKKCFSKFGVLEYALVCIDKLTEHSKGTGFVKFKDKSCAEKCLLQNNKICIEDNPLWLSVAVSKDNLEKQKNKRTGKDSRNLYLAKEGVVMAGSLAAKGVSVSDMAKRLEIENWKSQMLKNLNMFVSDRRLIIHNLPSTYDDSQLKALFLKHTHPKVCISEARVMRDKKKVDGKTCLGLSKEYGFVTFSTHEDALLGLRNINNNPKIFSLKKRPIVAFSIESKVALNVKQKRLEKSRVKLGVENNKSMKLNRKQRRSIKRRQKLMELRRETKKLKKEPPEKNNMKRKLTDVENNTTLSKKPKMTKSVEGTEEKSQEYCGIISEPGTKVRLQSRFKLKNQARIHKNQLKQEKSKRKKDRKTKVESIKQPKQKQNQIIVDDNSNLSKLIKKRRKTLEGSSAFKKWDEK